MKAAQGYDRANRVNFYIISVLLVVIIIHSFLINPFEVALRLSLFYLLAGITVVVTYFLPIHNRIKAIVIMAAPLVMSIYLLVFQGFSVGKHYAILLSLALSTLYLDEGLIIIWGIIFNLLIIVGYQINSEHIFGAASNVKELIGLLIMGDAVAFILYRSSKWSSLLKTEADENTRIASEAFEQLEKQVDVIKGSSEVLTTNIGNLQMGMKASKQASENISQAMHDIASTIYDQAVTATEINSQMAAAGNDIEKAKQAADTVIQSSKAISLRIDDGFCQLQSINRQMDTAGESMKIAVDTVTQLNNSMEEIVRFLDIINNIARETHLLSLNASIEAARAGEAGRGFAVVANEIKAFADDSKSAVSEIKEIIEAIVQQSEQALNEVIDGKSSIINGNEMIVTVTNYFSDIRQAINNSSSLIYNQIGEMDLVLNRALEVQSRIETVAAASEENSASTQEILAEIECEESNMQKLNQSVDEIQELTNQLQMIITGNSNGSDQPLGDE